MSSLLQSCMLQRELFCVVYFTIVTHINSLPLNTFIYLTVVMCVLSMCNSQYSTLEDY